MSCDPDIQVEELLQQKEIDRLLTFLLINFAFDREFLKTAIMEYYIKNCKLPKIKQPK